MRHRLLAAAVLLLAAPQLALGAPATIRVFEAPARSEPRPDAPVLHVFPEATPVSVSENAESGWRRVRLPDGSTAWLEESAIVLIDAPPAAPAPAPAPAAPPDLRAPLYVKDLDHLAELVKSDPVIAPKANRITTRRRAAYATMGVGLGVSAALTVVGIKQMNREFDRAFDSPGFEEPGNAGQATFASGLVVAVVTLITAAIIAPKHDDLLDVINGWNERHPEEPFEITPGGHTHSGHGHGAQLPR
jgi:hypothetical protein